MSNIQEIHEHLRAGNEVANICSQYLSGKSMREIGRFFGVNKETIRLRLLKAGVQPRPQVSKIVKHGQCRRGRVTSEYAIWQAMIQRCTNPDNKQFPSYGARGITVSDSRWLSFENFFSDMGPRLNGLTLDRLNNSLGYCKANCEWRTTKQQNRNSRKNRTFEYQGRIMTLAEAAERSGIIYQTLHSRMQRKQRTLEEAIAMSPSKPKDTAVYAFANQLKLVQPGMTMKRARSK